MLDDIAQAVLAREEVVKYLKHDPARGAAARTRIHEYLEHVDQMIEDLSARHANLAVASGHAAVEAAAGPLATRGIVVYERGRFRVRERSVLRCYARTIEDLTPTRGVTH